jgi:hypothetical protein
MENTLVLNPVFGFEELSSEELLTIDGGASIWQVAAGIAGAVCCAVGLTMVVVGSAAAISGVALLPGLGAIKTGLEVMSVGVALLGVSGLWR